MSVLNVFFSRATLLNDTYCLSCAIDGTRHRVQPCSRMDCLAAVSKGKRDRDLNVVQTSRGRQHLHKIPEQNAELAVRGEKLDQQRLYEAEADVEVKHWEKRNSDMAFHEID